MVRQTGSPPDESGLGCGLGFGSRCFRGRFDRLFQFLAEFGQVTRLKLAEQLDDIIPIVVAGEREEVKRGDVEAFGEPRNRLRGDGGEAVFHAGKVAFRQLASVGKVRKRHVTFGAQFAKARADFGGIGIRFKSSGHEWRISSCFGDDKNLFHAGRTSYPAMTYPKHAGIPVDASAGGYKQVFMGEEAGDRSPTEVGVEMVRVRAACAFFREILET